ncbi:MAG: TIM barrel protein [Acidobacteria bacterium]|nr:TIM barrel protein [Acidobacteriota bacterium]
MLQSISRRNVLKTAASAAGVLGVSHPFGFTLPAAQPKASFKQGVARWCYNKIPLDGFARAAADMGIRGVDLVGPEDWPTLKKYGLVCSITSGGGSIADGLNRKENHEKIEQEFRQNIPRAAAAGVPNVITFSGNRKGLSDEEGIENCIIGLNRVKGLAERHGVTICLELLNSKVNHKDYQCDHTAWGVEVVKRVNSPRVTLLYDIYHMQIMEGDVIATIRANKDWIGHYHTGGVPGRHEIDDSQELNYPAIMRAIAETGFAGFVSHEFVPTRDPLASLREAVRLCTV